MKIDLELKEGCLLINLGVFRSSLLVFGGKLVMKLLFLMFFFRILLVISFGYIIL